MNPVINSPFLFCEARHLVEGAGFIIGTDNPFSIGRILTFKENDSYLRSMANSTWPVVPVPGYMILIQYAGSLSNGRHILVHDINVAENIRVILVKMADFFMAEKVNLHTGYYKKFLIR